MSEAANVVRNAVARWDGVEPTAIELREEPGHRGTLVFVANAPRPGRRERERWFGARAIYVDAESGELFRVPSHAAFMPEAEEFLGDPGNRRRTSISEDA